VSFGLTCRLTLRHAQQATEVQIYIPHCAAVFKAGVFVAPVVDVPLSSLGDAAGTAADPFSFAIPAANLPETNRYAVKIAALNGNGAGPWSALYELAVYGEPCCWVKVHGWAACAHSKLCIGKLGPGSQQAALHI